MQFWLGSHRPNWLGQLDVPLMVSHRTLRDRKTFPRARAPWVLDSGGFTELNLHGQWTVSASEYADAIARYSEQVGQLVWAAPQDWMCEPSVRQKTGRSVAEHQALTVDNYLELRALDALVIPVLQGWARDDYHDHVDQYADAGVDLRALPVVGLGSVCRRSSAPTIADIVRGLARDGLRLHAFGVRRDVLRRVGYLLASADSMAWSFTARTYPPLPGCSHKSCANCQRFALKWRAETLRAYAVQQPELGDAA